jgi:PAS domain S-box-containing protein
VSRPPPRRLWSLRRLVFGWGLVSLLGMLAAFAMHAQREAEQEAWRRALAAAGAEMARITVVAERLVVQDASVVRELMVHAVLQEEADLVLVVDPDGRIAASTRAADRGRTLAEAHPALAAGAPATGVQVRFEEDRGLGRLRATRALAWPAAPGTLRTGERGTLWLQVDVAQQVQRQRVLVWRSHLAELLVPLLGGVLLLLALDRLLLRPLDRLREATERFGQGEAVAPPRSALREIDALGRTLSRTGYELRQSLQRVRDSEQRFRALAESAPDAIISLDQHGRIDQFNAAAERLFGYSAEEMIGQTLEPLLPAGSAEAHAQHVRAFGAEPEGGPRRMRAGRLVLGRHRDGRTLHLEVGISRSRLGEALQYTAMLRDVSDRVAIEAELEAHRRNLEGLVARRTAELQHERDQSQAATRAKSEFLARVGHELRTPMNTVLGMAHLLLQQADVREAPRVAALQGAARQLHALLEDILDFTRLEAGQLALVPTATELRALVEAAVQALPAARRRGEVELVLWIDADVPASVLVDGLRLRQVLVHLLDNALKFTPEGHVTLRVARGPALASGADAGWATLRFEVADSGIGMAAERLERLFEPFEQLDGGDTRAASGAGIGLVICQRVLALMGAELRAQSAPGRGSRLGFTLRLPELAPAAAPADEAAPRGRALVLDTLADARAAQAEAWRTLGWLADTADDRVAALRMLRAAAQRGEPYEWVLVGARRAGAALGLPGDALAQDTRPAPRWLLAVTADTRLTLADALRAGFAGLVDKPITAEALRTRLRLLATPAPADDEPLPAPPAPGRPPADVAEAGTDPLKALDGLEGLDLAQGLRSVRDDAHVYLRLLRSFADFHRGDVAALREAAAVGDAARLRARAHSLKSAAGSVGAVVVQALARPLADLPRDAAGAGETTRAQALELAAHLQSLVAGLDLRLAAAAAGPAAATAGAPAPAAGAEGRHALRERLGLRDMTALRWLQAVGDTELQALGLQPAALRQAVAGFDYDTALALVDEADANAARTGGES